MVSLARPASACRRCDFLSSCQRAGRGSRHQHGLGSSYWHERGLVPSQLMSTHSVITIPKSLLAKLNHFGTCIRCGFVAHVCW